MKKKFLFFIHSLNNGGAERVMSVLCSELVERGYEVHLGLYKRTEHDYPLDERVCVHQMSEKRSENKLDNMMFRIRQTRALIDAVKPAFVVPFMGTVVTETYLASRGKQCVLISAVRIDPLNMMKLGRMNRFLLMWAYHHSDAVFVQNEMQRACFSKSTQKKTFAVFNPVSEAFLAQAHQPRGTIRNIATGGRMTAQKNHKMLIDAIALVARKHPEVHLTIYGEGPLKSELENQVVQCGMQNNVTLYGRCHDMLSELQKNDLFVLSSNYEGMPNALLEAMALGMPCVSTDCRTGPRDMIVPYESGILTAVNAAEEMAQAICFMMENPEKANEMGRHARIFAKENCAKDVVIEKFLAECERFGKK